MERPAELADQEVFTAEEAASFSEEVIREQSRDEADVEAQAATGRVVPYNDFWFDWGSSVTTERTSLIVDPPDGRIPALTAAAERRRAAREAARAGVGRDEVAPGGWIDDLNPPVRCITGFNQGPPMTPSAYNNNMQLFQTEDHVVILNEMVHDARIVPLDGRPQLPADLQQWIGSSRGRWDGDTLVVETLNRRDESFRGSTRHLHLTERFTRADAEHARLRGDPRRSDHVDPAVDVRGADGPQRGRGVRVRLPRGQLLHGEHAPRPARRGAGGGEVAHRRPSRRGLPWVE